MRSAVNRWRTFALAVFTLLLLACAPTALRAQGGEPRYFAIRGANRRSRLEGTRGGRIYWA